MGFPLRIAVVGSGIGASHIEGFQELPNLFDIKILCDVNRERATAVAEKYRIQGSSGQLRRSLPPAGY
jgi:predicted dehydrogenase